MKNINSIINFTATSVMTVKSQHGGVRRVESICPDVTIAQRVIMIIQLVLTGAEEVILKIPGHPHQKKISIAHISLSTTRGSNLNINRTAVYMLFTPP